MMMNFLMIYLFRNPPCFALCRFKQLAVNFCRNLSLNSSAAFW